LRLECDSNGQKLDQAKQNLEEFKNRCDVLIAENAELKKHITSECNYASYISKC
jgi:hypothetical protein